MSVEIPKMALAFGGYGIPQGDVIECRVHLGCTKEVSSFDLLLQNWDGKYSPNGSVPLAVGVNGYICIGRGANVPQIIICRIESIKYEGTPTENYVRVCGRCAGGERLFRRVFTGTFQNMKGEWILFTLLLDYANLSFYRQYTPLTQNASAGQKNVYVNDVSFFAVGDYVRICENMDVWELNRIGAIDTQNKILIMTENLLHDYTAGYARVWRCLVEATDTTYAKLEYENTPVFDIIKYIADSADKNGVVGFDFRVAPDGVFEFFPRNSKTSPVSLSELIEEYEYRKDIHGIRNRITVYGAAVKKTPSDEDAWTESTSNWTSDSGSGQISLDSTNKKRGSYSVKHHMTSNDYKNAFYFDIYARTGSYLDATKYKELRVHVRCSVDCTGVACGTWIRLIDDAGNYVDYMINNSPKANTWVQHVLSLGSDAPGWDYNPNFNWSRIAKIRFCFWHDNVASDAWVDWLFFGKRRCEATQEDTNSKNAYGLRELVEVDEELYSDDECTLRAKALLDHYKNPIEHLTIKSTVIDYGNTPLLPGDKIHVTLPNEGVDADFRIETVEYHVDAKTQTLEITLELGRETPLLADYLYALRSKTDHLSRHKIAR
ncbi:MAG: hypothetical protein QXI91_07250 [Candidatus Bathyarchaeia archaeon]